MALKFKDRVRDVTASTGTGTLTLADTPPTNYVSLRDRYSTNDFFYGVIVHQTAAQYEVSFCKYLGSDQFSRLSVVDGSSGSGTLVNFAAGTKDFAVVHPSVVGDRELLTADRTYYVRTGGSDNNSGLVNDDSNAFATYQHAMDIITQTLDLGGFTVTISVQNAAWTATFTISEWIGGGAVVLDLNSGSITRTGGDCLRTTQHIPGDGFTIQNVTLSTVTSGNCITHAGSGYITIGAGVTFSSAAGTHILSQATGAIVQSFTNYTISGGVTGANSHWYVSGQGQIIVIGVTITLTGTPAFFSFVQCYGSLAQVYSNTYSGSASAGTLKFYIDQQGNIVVNSTDLTLLPGGTAGSLLSGFYG